MPIWLTCIMNEIKILTSQAIPGMVVAEDVYTKDHNLIIAKDTILTDRIITRLEFYDIADFLISSGDELMEQETEYLENTYYEEVKKSESFKRFHQAYQNTLDNFKGSFEEIITEDSKANTDYLLSEVNNILYQCNTSIELFDMLHCLRHYDDTTYVHSLNVALICNIIGKWLDFSKEDLEVITLCGLLHDIGKLLIPSEIITKPAKLTAEEFSTVKTHTLRGYNLLKNKNIDSRIKLSTLMHHERCDGSGYPYGFTSKQIDPFAQLVAIADVYDAMTCARVYRGALCPFEVLHIFETEGLTKYDPRYIMTFLEGIVQTYIHNSVILSDGQEGEVVLINRLALSRPVVMVGKQFIDLSRHSDLYITALV